MKHGKSGIVQGMMKRIVVFAIFPLLLFSAGACSKSGRGDVEGAETLTLRTLRIIAVNGETFEPAANVLVDVREQSTGAQNVGRQLVHATKPSAEDGVAVFRIPEGNYVIRSLTPDWSGVLTVNLQHDAQLYLNLRYFGDGNGT